MDEKMGAAEWKRLNAVEQVEAGELNNQEAATTLGLSARQMRRVRARVRKLGRRGAMHGNKGRASAQRIRAADRARVEELGRGKYQGFNDQHLTEKLSEVEGLALSRSSVRRILRAAGVGPVRKRRAARHRQRRERKPQAGQMVLWDGSQHRWLEERGPQLCLMGAIDDATGELLGGAHFVKQECAAGYLKLVLAMAGQQGLPCSIYMDHHGSLVRNDDHWSAGELARGKQHPTQVGRALEQLGIRVIRALTPQAKGRVERLWGTLQDRLVSELRLAGASDQEAANAVLKNFIASFNRRFAKPAAVEPSAWRQLHDIDVIRACSLSYETKVQNDNTVRMQGMVIDIAPGAEGRSYAHCRVALHQLLDGSWRVYYDDQLLATAAPNNGSKELRALKGTNKARYRTEHHAAALQPNVSGL